MASAFSHGDRDLLRIAERAAYGFQVLFLRSSCSSPLCAPSGDLESYFPSALLLTLSGFDKKLLIFSIMVMGRWEKGAI